MKRWILTTPFLVAIAVAGLVNESRATSTSACQGILNNAVVGAGAVGNAVLCLRGLGDPAGVQARWDIAVWDTAHWD